MATVKTGVLTFWRVGTSSHDLVKPVGKYVLGRRQGPGEAIKYVQSEGGKWSDDYMDFTPWPQIGRITVAWHDETISEALAEKLIAEGRTDVVRGEVNGDTKG